MNILITGAAGFIGSNFMYYMKEKHPDDMLIALDKLTYAGNLKNLKGMEDYPNYKFIKGDISDRAFIYKLFEDEKPDVVINFAAESHVDRSTVDPESFMNANVVGVGVLLDACRI